MADHVGIEIDPIMASWATITARSGARQCRMGIYDHDSDYDYDYDIIWYWAWIPKAGRATKNKTNTQFRESRYYSTVEVAADADDTSVVMIFYQQQQHHPTQWRDTDTHRHIVYVCIDWCSNLELGELDFRTWAIRWFRTCVFDFKNWGLERSGLMALIL